MTDWNHFCQAVESNDEKVEIDITQEQICSSAFCG